MKDSKKRSGSAMQDPTQNTRLSIWRVVGLTVVIVLFIAAAAVVISGKGVGKRKYETMDYEKDELLYSVSADSILELQSIPGRIALLESNALLYLDEGGNEIASNEHKYANPVMLSAGKNIFLYDEGGTAFRVETNADVFVEKTVSAPIICADICSNGTYAYVLNADAGYQSHLYVYSYKGNRLFEWGSASDYVLGVRLSSGGKYIVINELSVDNAEHTSKVICFKIGREEPVFSVELKNTTVYATRFFGADKTVLFTDKGIFQVRKDGSVETTVEYAQNELNRSCLNPSGVSLVALNKYGNEKNAVVTIFDKRFKKSYEISFDDAVSEVCASDDYAAVVSGDVIRILNAYGTVIGNIDPEEKCFGMVFSGRRLFVLTAGGLQAYHTSDGKS